jgi:phosphatidylserine decarboxylase
MRLHKAGYATLIISLTVIIAINVIIFTFMPSQRVAGIIILVFSVVLYLFLLWFFRIPSRVLPGVDNAIVSPADGRIVAIEETQETEYFNQKRVQVSIFMSPLDVHANVFPISGEVKYYKYHPGKYLVAWHPKASASNERNTVVIETDNKKAILVRQIAGAVARRIVCYAHPGNQVRQGDELGFIKFGSRVDLFLPPEVRLQVAIGQKVTGKISVIATFK